MRGRGSLADLARPRNGAYRLFGSLFLYPERSDVDGWVELARELRGSEPLHSFPFYGRLHSLLDSLAEMREEDAVRLEEEYVDRFVLSVSHAPCPLHESAYVDRSGRRSGLVAVGVERAYAAAGMALSPAAHGELPDHAAFELEFLSHLCAQEALAWEVRRLEVAASLLRSQKQFLDRHLLRWFPGLARRTSLAASGGNFYGELVGVAHAFVVHDRDLVDLLLEEAGAIAPSIASKT